MKSTDNQKVQETNVKKDVKKTSRKNSNERYKKDKDIKGSGKGSWWTDENIVFAIEQLAQSTKPVVPFEDVGYVLGKKGKAVKNKINPYVYQKLLGKHFLVNESTMDMVLSLLQLLMRKLEKDTEEYGGNARINLLKFISVMTNLKICLVRHNYFLTTKQGQAMLEKGFENGDDLFDAVEENLNKDKQNMFNQN
jgi:hypothetical protein